MRVYQKVAFEELTAATDACSRDKVLNFGILIYPLQGVKKDFVFRKKTFGEPRQGG